ncbi:MAG: cobalamin-binding protein [Chloroflexi bacterium]|nr:cobalamin-binding protein [Chloroflexota bacterium]
MRRFLWMLSLVFLVAYFVSGCGASAPVAGSEAKPTALPAASPTASSLPLSFSDDAGRSVTVAKLPQKIVSLSPDNTEILFALGLGGQVVGVDEYSDFPPEAQKKDKVGSFAKIDIEKVVALEPDVILAADMHAKTVVPELEKRGFTVIVLQPRTIEGVLDNIRLVGRIADKSKEAETLASDLQRRIDDVVRKVGGASAKPRVFFELDANLFTVGPDTFVDDMIRKAGGENIAADAKNAWPQMSQEAIVLKDPEVIILADHGLGATPESVKSRPGWQQITAVKTDRIVPLDPDLVNRPGPRVVNGLESLAKAIHPELFRD